MKKAVLLVALFTSFIVAAPREQKNMLLKRGGKIALVSARLAADIIEMGIGIGLCPAAAIICSFWKLALSNSSLPFLQQKLYFFGGSAAFLGIPLCLLIKGYTDCCYDFIQLKKHLSEVPENEKISDRGFKEIRIVTDGLEITAGLLLLSTAKYLSNKIERFRKNMSVTMANQAKNPSPNPTTLAQLENTLQALSINNKKSIAIFSMLGSLFFVKGISGS